jgi:HK97 family phage prohead protease
VPAALPTGDGVKKKAPASSRVRSFIASDETVDRYNTIIRASGWELGNFVRNPVILFGHEGRALPIGKGRAWVSGSQLRLDVEFLPEELNPMAEQAMRILDAGLMGVSVGFNPIAYEYNESRETGTAEDFFFPPLDFTRTELLEVSVVTIPANPSALPVGRDLVEARMMERAASPRARVPVRNLMRLVPGLVREALSEVTAELRATRARRTGRIS